MLLNYPNIFLLAALTLSFWLAHHLVVDFITYFPFLPGFYAQGFGAGHAVIRAYPCTYLDSLVDMLFGFLTLTSHSFGSLLGNFYRIIWVDLTNEISLGINGNFWNLTD